MLKNPFKKNKKPFCNAPFSSLYFNYNGNVLACCNNHKHILGTYPAQSISQIWQGQPINELRELLRNNKLFSGCNACYEQLLEGNTDNLKSRDYDNLICKSAYPVLLEFALDNTCNLECVMCDAELSSKIREKKHLKQIASPYDEQFLLQLDEFIPHLKEAKFYGGEPFLIPLYYKIWEKIISINPSCIINVQTNGTLLNEKIKNIISKARFSITVSIDAVNKELFENIRKNSQFETVMAHADFFQAYCKNKKTFFGYSFCPIRTNWQEIPDFINLANKKNVPVYFHTVWLPPDVAIWTLEYTKLSEIYQFLDSCTPALKNITEKHNAERYSTLKNFVSSWMDYKKTVSALNHEISHLDCSGLEGIIIKKIKNYCLEIKNVNEKDFNTAFYAMLIKKTLAQLDNTEQIILLQRLNEIPAHIIVSIMEHPSEDFAVTNLKLFLRC